MIVHHRTLPNGKGHGWRKDSIDPRDFMLAEHVAKKALSPVIELKTPAAIPHVRDQSDLGACTGFGNTAALMYLLRSRRSDRTQMSPLWLYFQERVIEKTVKSDSGAEIRDGANVLGNLGCASEADDPYNVKLFAKAPNAKANKDAAKFKVGKRLKCPTVDDVLQALAADMPVVDGFTCFSEIDSADTARTGVIQMPKKKSEKPVGGHCTCIVKADQPSRMFLFQNSWSEDWGIGYAGSKGGYGLLPFAYLEQGLADDFWAYDLAA